MFSCFLFPERFTVLDFTGDLQIKLHLADLIAAFTQPSGKQRLDIILTGKRVY